jgi:hypothetical protein
MSRTILCSDQANVGKNTEIKKQPHVKFWFKRKKMELSHIYLAVMVALITKLSKKSDHLFMSLAT